MRGKSAVAGVLHVGMSFRVLWGGDGAWVSDRFDTCLLTLHTGRHCVTLVQMLNLGLTLVRCELDV